MVSTNVKFEFNFFGDLQDDVVIFQLNNFSQHAAGCNHFIALSQRGHHIAVLFLPLPLWPYGNKVK